MLTDRQHWRLRGANPFTLVCVGTASVALCVSKKGNAMQYLVSRGNKPHFYSLSEALEYIKERAIMRKALLKERSMWQDMQQDCIDDGGSWDSD